MSLSEEVFFLYSEHLEQTRLYMWYSESPHSFFQGKSNKVLAAQAKTMSDFFFKKLLEKVRGQK